MSKSFPTITGEAGHSVIEPPRQEAIVVGRRFGQSQVEHFVNALGVCGFEQIRTENNLSDARAVLDGRRQSTRGHRPGAWTALAAVWRILLEAINTSLSRTEA